MKRTDLLIILEVISLKMQDIPGLKGLYDELLDAYNATKVRPDYRLPIQPDLTYLEIRP